MQNEHLPPQAVAVVPRRWSLADMLRELLQIESRTIWTTRRVRGAIQQPTATARTTDAASGALPGALSATNPNPDSER